MKILIYGKNTDKVFKFFKGYKTKYNIVSHNVDIPHQDKISDCNFAFKMELFAHVCKQSYIPGCINIYKMSPWSFIRRHKPLDTSEHRTLLTYYNILGWKPDIAIYLWDPKKPDPLLDDIMDSDNRSGIKVFTMNANEPFLEKNIGLIYNDIIANSPTDELLSHITGF